jgi:hypothetical protein
VVHTRFQTKLLVAASTNASENASVYVMLRSAIRNATRFTT